VSISWSDLFRFGSEALSGVPGTLLATALSLLFLALVFIPLETAFPARQQSVFRPAWFTDLGFFLGQYLLWTSGVFWILGELMLWMDQAELFSGLQAKVAGQPWFLQALEIVVLSDFCIYWAHRFQHKIPWLWRFHSVHHSSEHLDWLAAHREHPLDTIYTVGIINLPAAVLGFPLETLAGFIAFRGIWAIYIHSNVRLPMGPLRVLIGAPELHHWHHDKDRDAGNYANISPLMDLLFGTYHCPDHEPEAFGIHEPSPKGYLSQLWQPLFKKS
jgi:sterol desaturase/sphingolipid hydroxylase (fatty acid hydroxylase superfamily)